MRLETLRLKNFRCFDELALDLHPRLTVLVAENGQGKSAMLDAIRIALAPFVNSFDLARWGFNDPGNSITVSDVRLIRRDKGDMVRQMPCEVTMVGDYGCGESTTWSRYRDKEDKATKTKDGGDTHKLKKWASRVQAQIRDRDAPELQLPVFGYYGTGRLWSQKQLRKAPKGRDDTKDPDFYMRLFAYRHCLDPASSYKHFKEWFTWAFESLREQQIHELEGRSDPEELRAAQERIRVVQQAIDTFLKPVTGWHTLEYSVSREKSLVLHHDQQGILDVEQLSDGIRSMLAMVGDIAYRCIKLNPQLGEKAALETSGVVMIDEVDMHLHPRWQQRVLEQFQQAFPRIQFIVTTHSPQVLSTVPAKSIRILVAERDESLGQQSVQIHEAGQETQGTTSSDLMAAIMGTDPMPDIAIARQLSQYHALIQQDEERSDKARRLREELEQHYGATHPLMLECDRLIRLQALKRRKPAKA